LKDINGLVVKHVINGPSFVLNKEMPNDVLLDEWLRTHPNIIGEFYREDVVEKEKIQTEKTLNAAQAIIEAAKMNVKSVIDFAKLNKMNLNSDTEVLRAKIIELAQSNPSKFMDIHFDPEKDYRVFIVDALKSKNLTYKNSTFMYGKEAIGTNEEQVIVWLKENKDIFALIKHELRGEQPVKKVVKQK
jgi:vacuolar-type H+-ATPase subunit I/STV1